MTDAVKKITKNILVFIVLFPVILGFLVPVVIGSIFLGIGITFLGIVFYFADKVSHMLGGSNLKLDNNAKSS